MEIDSVRSKLPKIGSKGSKTVAKFTFTKKALETLPIPTSGQRAYYYDSKVRGLAIAISPAGRRTFVHYKKVNGRPERINIGPFPDLSIEQARGNASELNAAIARGRNPAEERRGVRQESTLSELFTVFGEKYAALALDFAALKGRLLLRRGPPRDYLCYGDIT